MLIKEIICLAFLKFFFFVVITIIYRDNEHKEIFGIFVCLGFFLNLWKAFYF